MITWTKEDITKFKRLVDMGASRNQMDRINSRLDMPQFIKDHGRSKCNAMYDIISSGGPIEAGERER